MTSIEGARCADCDAPLCGPYCAQCGQRRFDDRDRRLSALLGEFWHELTSLDGKLWRSLAALGFRPGRLTREWFDGRRSRWSRPLTLFLVANLLYFLAPALTDFNLPFVDQVPGRLGAQLVEADAADAEARRARRLGYDGQLHSPLTAAWVERRVAARAASRPGYSLADYERAYDRESESISKLLIVVHVPLLALALLALFPDRRRYFAEHFVAALHLFTFLLLVVQVGVMPAAALLGAAGEAGAAGARILPYAWLALVVVHFALALARAYGAGPWRAGASALALLVALAAAHLVVYRTLQFALVFALT